MKVSSLYRSLESLHAWTEKLLEIARLYAAKKSSFIEEGDFYSYLKFYKELSPYIEMFALAETNEEIHRLTKEYFDNERMIEQNLEQKPKVSLLSSLFSWTDDHFYPDRNDALESALKGVYNNVTNLLYQIRINYRD